MIDEDVAKRMVNVVLAEMERLGLGKLVQPIRAMAGKGCVVTVKDAVPEKAWDTYATYEEALGVYNRIDPKAHLLICSSGRWAVMWHINCEWCHYCEVENKAYQLGTRPPFVLKAVSDPYRYRGRE